MKDPSAAPAPRDDRFAEFGVRRRRLEEMLVAPESEPLVVGLGLRVAELRPMNLELRDALVTLHDRYEELSDLSHDLGDDLTTILASATGTWLSDPTLDPAAGEALERIRQAAERMARRIGASSTVK
jgi:signal transduction histidine kinase